MAGGVQAKGGRKPAWMASLLAPVPEVRSQGRRNRRDGTSRGVAVCLCFSAIREISRGRYQGAPFGVPSPLMGRGEKKLKAQLARRRGNASVWLFEIRIRKIRALVSPARCSAQRLRRTGTHAAAIRGGYMGPRLCSAPLRKCHSASMTRVNALMALRCVRGTRHLTGRGGERPAPYRNGSA
jgi:hypothetical protein